MIREIIVWLDKKLGMHRTKKLMIRPRKYGVKKNKYTDKLLSAVHEIAGLIYCQAPLEEQDRWLLDVIEQGLWEPEVLDGDN